MAYIVCEKNILWIRLLVWGKGVGHQLPQVLPKAKRTELTNISAS